MRARVTRGGLLRVGQPRRQLEHEGVDHQQEQAQRQQRQRQREHDRDRPDDATAATAALFDTTGLALVRDVVNAIPPGPATVRALPSPGVGPIPGDRVALHLGWLPETVVAMMACVRLGAELTVIPVALPVEALALRLAAFAPRILVTQDQPDNRAILRDLRSQLRVNRRRIYAFQRALVMQICNCNERLLFVLA